MALLNGTAVSFLQCRSDGAHPVACPRSARVPRAQRALRRAFEAKELALIECAVKRDAIIFSVKL